MIVTLLQLDVVRFDLSAANATLSDSTTNRFLNPFDNYFWLSRDKQVRN